MSVVSAVDLALLELARAIEKTGYRFTALTPESHRLVNARAGNTEARDLRGIFGWSRAFDVALLPQDMLALMRAAEAVEPSGLAWRSRFRIASIGELLFLHSAFPTAAADAVFFGPDTYRFIAALQQALAGGELPHWRRAADIGCGSGAAGIVLARTRPDATVVMTDINPGALRLSRINAVLAKTANVEIRAADLLDGVEGRFDLLVANPPYLLDPAKRLYRHGGGARGEGLSLAIVDGNDPFRQAVAGRLEGSADLWRYREIDPDVFGEELAHSDADRVAAVFLTLTKAK